MENRVYYGEYSLKHWIELILKRNVILPDYQRFFVWNEAKVETLLETFRKRQFVPPVTIGAFKTGTVTQNLILDGQQRLTSILLCYLGLYPDKATLKNTLERYADENDSLQEPEEEFDNVIEWTFKLLVDKGKTKTEILQKVKEGNYKVLQFDINEEFLESTFLGFSYLVPYVSDEKQQQKYYSSVFRNINVQGQVLLPQESRASLYFLDESLEKFFAPDFFKRFVIKTPGNESKADFVRYLSLLSQYKKDKQSNRIARGYKLQMEKYYEQYIYSVVGESASLLFDDFLSMFPGRDYEVAYSRLEEGLQLLDIPTQFSSIIEADVYLFGIIYTVVFCKESINPEYRDDLKGELTNEIEKFKNDLSHARAPAALKYLRMRIDSSIEVYDKYATI